MKCAHQVKQIVHVSGPVVAGADALLVFGGQGLEQPDLLTLLPMPHDEQVRLAYPIRARLRPYRTVCASESQTDEASADCCLHLSRLLCKSYPDAAINWHPSFCQTSRQF